MNFIYILLLLPLIQMGKLNTKKIIIFVSQTIFSSTFQCEFLNNKRF